MASTLTVNINAIPDIGEGILNNFGGLDFSINRDTTNISFFEQFVNVRINNNEAGVGGSNTLTSAASNLALALNTDFNTTQGFNNAIATGNQVIVTLDDGWDFTQAQIIFFSPDVTVSFNNVPVVVVDPISFTSTFSAGSPVCDNIDVTFNITGGTAPYFVSINGNSISGNVFRALRGSAISVSITDSGSESAQSVVSVPRSHVSSDFNINIIQTPEGSTVEVQTIVPAPGTAPLQYSLNNVDFVDSNTFSGQTPGDYTVFIRDQFGCITSISYSISDVSPEPLEPLFIMPEANSIRYYKIEDETCIIRPNYYNSASCQEAVRGISYQEPNFFEPCDVIPTQFKTNHSGLNAKLILSDETEQVLPIIERVTNIGLVDVRDSKYFRVDDSNIGVFFDSGNTYDPDTLNINGTYSQLNGLLPSFIAEGVFMNVAGLGVKEVISTEFDQTREVWYAKVSGSLFSDNTVTAIATTNYNVQPYNVYELILDMTTRLNTNFVVEISTDLITYRSEEIRVIERVPGVVLHYWNTENKFDIVYSSDPLVQHTLRVRELDVVKMVLDSQVQNYNSDNEPIQLDSKLYKQFELRGENITTAYYFKIALALSHDVVFVNGLQMTLQEISQDENIENTNLYNPRFLMIEGGNVAQRQREQTINLTTLAAIRLEANLGFINYRA